MPFPDIEFAESLGVNEPSEQFWIVTFIVVPLEELGENVQPVAVPPLVKSPESNPVMLVEKVME